jgi:hypothetical protein
MGGNQTLRALGPHHPFCHPAGPPKDLGPASYPPGEPVAALTSEWDEGAALRLG